MKKLHFNRPTTIGEIPTIYLDSLTYLEQLTRVVKYLQDEVVPMLETMKQDIENQNDNIENAINDINTNLQDFETTIQNYIDTTNASLEAYKNTLTSEWNTYKEDTTNNYNTFTTNITNAFNEFKTSTTNALNTFKTEMQDEYASFINTVNSTMSGYETEINNQLKQIQDIASDVNTYTNKINKAVADSENAVKKVNNIGLYLDKGTEPFTVGKNITGNNISLNTGINVALLREKLKTLQQQQAITYGIMITRKEGSGAFYKEIFKLVRTSLENGLAVFSTGEGTNNITSWIANIYDDGTIEMIDDHQESELTLNFSNYYNMEVVNNKDNNGYLTNEYIIVGDYTYNYINKILRKIEDLELGGAITQTNLINLKNDLQANIDATNNYLDNGISNTNIQEASAGMNIVGKYLNINTNYIKDNFDTIKTKVTNGYKPIIFNDDTYISIGINNHRPNGDTGNDYINIGISNSTNNNIMIPSLGGASGCLITIDKTGAIVETIPLGDNPINFSNPVPLWAESIKTYTPNYHSASGDTDFYIGGIFSIVTLDKQYIESKMIQLSQLMFDVDDLSQAVVQNQEQTEADVNNLQTNINENTSSINNLTQKAETNEANINTLLGQFTVAESSITASITNPINYPEGYNQTNTVIAGVMLRRNGTNVWDWTNHDVAKMIISTGSNNINVEVYNRDSFRYDRIRLLLYK